MSPRVIQLPMSGRDRRHYVRELRAAEQAHQSLLVRVEDAYRVAHQLLCEEWNTRQFIGGPVDPSPTIAQATHGGCVLLEVRCKRCGHESEVNLKEIVWPRSNQVHTLAKVLRCQRWRQEVAPRSDSAAAADTARAAGEARSQTTGRLTVKKRLSKADLAAEFLKRLQAYEGCEGVSKVILEDRSDKDSDCNWDFSVIEAADAADPVAVGPAVIEVYGEMADEFEMLTLH
jgi:hypothetical protein